MGTTTWKNSNTFSSNSQLLLLWVDTISCFVGTSSLLQLRSATMKHPTKSRERLAVVSKHRRQPHSSMMGTTTWKNSNTASSLKLAAPTPPPMNTSNCFVGTSSLLQLRSATMKPILLNSALRTSSSSVNLASQTKYKSTS
jgi:hypothetical protein